MTHNFKLSHFCSGCRHLWSVSNKAGASPWAAAEVSQRMRGIDWQRCCQILPLRSAAAKFRQRLSKLTRPTFLYRRKVVTSEAVHSPAFASTKLYCLVTEAHRCEKLAQSFYAVVPRRASNPRTLDCESDTLPQYHDATQNMQDCF